MASRHDFLQHCFVVQEKDIEKLHASIAEALGPVAMEATCSDRISRDFNSLESLLGYENPLARQILSLRLSASNKDLTARLWLSFDSRSHSTVFVSLDGPADIVYRLNEIVEDRLQAMQPWYAPLARFDFVLIGLATYIALYFTLLAALALGLLGSQATAESSTNSSDTAIANLLVWGTMLAILTAGIVLNRIRGRLFPWGTFALGQGEARYDTMEKWRWTVVIGSAVSLLAGLLLKLLLG